MKFYKKKRYDLALIEPRKGTTFTQCKWELSLIKNPYKKEKWFADPFILDYDDRKIVVLVEEMDYKIGRGRIARLLIDRETNTITDVKILLDLSTHLSFPAIERVGDDVYVYPENSASGNLTLYKYIKSSETLEPVKELIKEPLTDTIIKEIDGERYIFSTKMPSPNGNQLNVYKKEGKGYSLLQEIQFAGNTARGAGDWFEESGRLIRPAQDCNGYYGVGLVFQNVEFKGDKFHFEEIGRVGHPKGYDGMHTFNKYKDMCIIDLRRPVYPAVYYPLKFVSDFVRRML